MDQSATTMATTIKSKVPTLADDDELHPSGSDEEEEDKQQAHSQKTEAQKKKKGKKKKNMEKMKRFAETIGVEENENYPKFKEKERLIINMSNCKYFVIRFVAKKLFNFKLSFK